VIIIIALISLILLALIIIAVDYRIIKENNNKKLVFTYALLMIIGIVIGFITILDLPVPSPAIIIEKIIAPIIER